ncbi:snRNA-activating protein complex subunit 1b [Pholidichthys leucotaenia]
MDFCSKQVRADCEELLSCFMKTKSVRFEIFSNIWREMKFTQIFYGTLYHEKRPFARLLLDTAAVFFLPPFSFQIRVGGLYLLYSLYQCQTAVPPEMIRLALKDWEEVKKFEKDAIDAQHFDAIYVLRWLMSVKAFHFTAMPSRLLFKRRKTEEGSHLCDEFMERVSRPQELINMELLEELSNVHELYEKLKVTAVPQANMGVGLIRKNLVSELSSSVMEFYKWQKSKSTADDDDEDSGEGTSSQQESSKRAALLTSIKSKAYGEAMEVSRSRRHRQMEMGFSIDEEGSAPTATHSRVSKPSLKTRMMNNFQLSGDLGKEAAATTQINCLAKLDSGADEKPKHTKRFKWS